MRIEYSKEADALYVYFRQIPVAKSKAGGEDRVYSRGQLFHFCILTR